MHEIETPRLRLVTMGPAVMRALIAEDAATAASLLGAATPQSWPGLEHVFRMRLAQLEARPDDEPWLMRAIVLARESRVAGVTGFHGPPGGDWLRDHAPDGVEFGFTIFERDRRRGYATEAGTGLMEWVTREHHARCFVLSMLPTNAASQGVARKLGFRRAGEWLHTERGRELVYLKRVDREARP